MTFKPKLLARTGLSASGLLVALAFLTPITASADDEVPEMTYDGLVLVADRKVAAAYVDPDADFGEYNKIMLLDCYVSFRKNWQRDHKRTGSMISVSKGDMERIKTGVAELFHEVFTEELSKDGGYEIVDAAGEDVLLVRPAIIDLDVTAPDTSSPGRTRTYTASSGAATVFVELFDSVTGDVLARAADRKVAERMGGYLSYSNRVTNTADAKKMMRGWAKSLRERLDEYHGR